MPTISRRRECKECHKITQIRGHDLCGACWQRRWRKNHPEQAKAIALRYRSKHLEQESAAHKAYYEKNRIRLIEKQRINALLRVDEKRNYNKKYQQENKGRLDGYYRAWRLAAKYGLSMKDYEALVIKQNGLCAICQKPQSAAARNGAKLLHVDHCHATNKVRGLLCMPCNTALGHLDDAEWVRKATAYLARAQSS
jgi:hypothetical protein